MAVRVATFIGGVAAVVVLCLVAPDSDAARVGYDLAIVVTMAIVWHGTTKDGNDRLASRRGSPAG